MHPLFAMKISAPLLGLALAFSPAAAQSTSPLELDWKYGYLDWTWQLDLKGAPLSAYVVLPSLQTGPTPLALFDPADPRELAIGLDLTNLARFGFTNGQGKGLEQFNLPSAPALAGMDLRAQAMTLPGQATLFDALSNPVSTRLTALGQDVPTQGQPITARGMHGQVALQDGRVLLVGGLGANGQPALEVELFDPQLQSFVPVAGQLAQPTEKPCLTLLDDGRVLISGGADPATGIAHADCYLFDPVGDLLVPTAPMAAPRVLHRQAPLPGGAVLAIGGATTAGPGGVLGWWSDAQVCSNAALASCERFDPMTEQWTPAPQLPMPLVGHGASRMPGGAILVSGGATWTGQSCDTVAEVFVFSGGQPWTLAGVLTTPRAMHAQVETVEGKLLVRGGVSALPQGSRLSSGPIPGELFDPAASSSQPGPTTNGLIIGGDEVCIPVPRVPKFPGAAPQSLLGDGPPVVYYAGGGFSDLGGFSGVASPFTLAERAYSSAPSWVSMTAGGVDVGLGHQVTPVDDGERLLFVGPAGARLLTVQ